MSGKTLDGHDVSNRLVVPHTSWGIFGCDADVPSSGGVQAVSAKVASILESAREYPPALGLARDEASAFPDGTKIGRHEFAERYAERVTHHLSRQRDAPYVVAEAEVDEPGYLSRSERYWILRYLRGANEVRWVSEDFQIYQNPAAHFRLTTNQLADLLLPFENAV